MFSYYNKEEELNSKSDSDSDDDEDIIGQAVMHERPSEEERV